MTETEASQAEREWRQYLIGAAVAHAVGLAGVANFRGIVEADPTRNDPILFGIGDPNDPDTRFHGVMRMGELRPLLARDGPISIEIGRQWLVTVYAMWEADYRPRIKEETGTKPVVPLMGDLRHLRHDVLHCRAIATQGHCGQLEVLGHWVTIGEEIRITTEMVAEFMQLYGLTMTSGQLEANMQRNSPSPPSDAAAPD